MDYTTTQLLQQLQGAASNASESGRQQLLAVARSLVHSLEKPEERLGRMCWLDSYMFGVIRVCIDLDLFTKLSEGTGAKTADELGGLTGADPKLLERFLKVLGTEDIVNEVGPDTYEANAMTRLLSTDAAKGAVIDMWNLQLVNYHIPAFLKQHKYVNPTDKDVSAWKHTGRTDKHYFDWVFTPGNEDAAEAFRQHMQFKNSLGKAWFENQELFNHVFGGDAFIDAPASGEKPVVLIDVGGSDGYILKQCHLAHPRMAQTGRLILQDLPGQIDSLDKASLIPIEAMPYDLFTPQPVREARAYYLKMVLHDWPDEQCKEMLVNLRSAMKPGYSKILINDIVIPETGAGWFEVAVDLVMMWIHSAQERRERAWRSMIESVEGLKVTKIWNIEGASEKVIEVDAV